MSLKKELMRPLVAVGVGFLIVWYVITQQSVVENLTGSPELNDEDKRAINRYLDEKMATGDTSKCKMTSKATTFVQFLETNPVNSIDDAMVKKYIDLEKKASFDGKSANEGKEILLKTKLQAQASKAITTAIFGYADTYKKLEKVPERSEFDREISSIIKNDGLLNMVLNMTRNASSQMPLLEVELKNTKEGEPPSWDQGGKFKEMRIKSYEKAIANSSLLTLPTGPNDYPLPSSRSPVVTEMYDIVYRYYFPSFTPTGSTRALWKTIVAFVGSFGAIIVGAIIIYYVYTYVASRYGSNVAPQA